VPPGGGPRAGRRTARARFGKTEPDFGRERRGHGAQRVVRHHAVDATGDLADEVCRRNSCGTSVGVPCSHHGAVAAIAAVMRSHDHRSSLVSSSCTAGTPGRGGTARAAPWRHPFPKPRTRATPTRWIVETDAARVDVAQHRQGPERLPHVIAVDERVVGHGRVRAASPQPAGQIDHHGAVTDHRTPPLATSPCSAKLAANASRTGANAGSQVARDRHLHGAECRTAAPQVRSPLARGYWPARLRLCREMTGARPSGDRSVRSVAGCSGGSPRAGRSRSRRRRPWSLSWAGTTISDPSASSSASPSSPPACSRCSRGSAAGVTVPIGAVALAGALGARHGDQSCAPHDSRDLWSYAMYGRNPERPPHQPVVFSPRTSTATRTSRSSRAAWRHTTSIYGPGVRAARGDDHRCGRTTRATVVAMAFTGTFAGATAPLAAWLVHRRTGRASAAALVLLHPADRARHPRRGHNDVLVGLVLLGAVLLVLDRPPRCSRGAAAGAATLVNSHGRDRIIALTAWTLFHRDRRAANASSRRPRADWSRSAYLPLGTTGLSAFVHNRGSLSRASAMGAPAPAHRARPPAHPDPARPADQRHAAARHRGRAAHRRAHVLARGPAPAVDHPPSARGRHRRLPRWSSPYCAPLVSRPG